MQSGDIVCLIYGATRPFLIRAKDECGKFELVGECFVYGLIEGEGMTMGEETNILLN